MNINEQIPMKQQATSKRFNQKCIGSTTEKVNNPLFCFFTCIQNIGEYTIKVYKPLAIERTNEARTYVIT